MPFVYDNIRSKDLCCLHTDHVFLHRQVLASYPKFSSVGDSNLLNVLSILVS